MQIRLDPASGVVSGPAFPERLAAMSGGAQGFVAGACLGQSSFHRRPFFRIRMTGVASRARMAVWQRRVADMHAKKVASPEPIEEITVYLRRFET